jgi:ABC-type transport system involved in Fe-S cluster assembly fused permease/ATPase subunit
VLAWVFDISYLLVLAVTIALYIWFTFKVTEWRVKIRREMNAQDTDANQKAVDSLLNFETVKYFGAERARPTATTAPWRATRRRRSRLSVSLAFLNFGQSLIITTGLVIVMVMAAIGVQSGDADGGRFRHGQRLHDPDHHAAELPRHGLPRDPAVAGGHGRDVRPAGAAARGRDKPGAPALDVSGGEVVFDDVRFAYDPARPILKGVSFRVAPGETLALVGPSGSGKSTIGRLLFRFYDVVGGAIRIDGQDLRDVTQESLHARIGVVPQDTVLFNDTIRYNIAYGRPEATEDEIEAAAKAAKIHDFIMGLPEGYDTAVGERGLKLSGGEKQRVGIARTLLKDPPILLLDEATSALDTETERSIQSELKMMGQGRSVITIAHRLSTIVDADRIMVLEAGEVVEQGTHDDLLRKGGRYADLWAGSRCLDDRCRPVAQIGRGRLLDGVAEQPARLVRPVAEGRQVPERSGPMFRVSVRRVRGPDRAGW